ncbi:glutamate 5-kinase [Deltaproteobacteria bacterium]|nr:glutamate 5-kinase [Deltaproteobacteria bacterium]
MNFLQEKESHITRAKRVVVKVGSAVLASQDGLNLDRVESLARDIARLHDTGRDVILVSSGAVAAGRGVMRDLRKISSKALPDKQAAAAVGQSRLMYAYDKAFAAQGKISAQVLLTRDDLRSRGRFLNARNTFATLLEWRAIPVVNENDTVAVTELKFGDNDNLASLILNLTAADIFINLTSAEGVFDKDPDTFADAKILECIDDIQSLDVKLLCGAKTSLGSGGMASKLRAARRAAQLGVATYIVPGRVEGILEEVFTRPAALHGTWVRPLPKAIPSRKFWLAYNADPAGSLVIDAGAKEALLIGGKSLLPAGITAITGNFAAGSLVLIVGPDKAAVGVGLCNYSATELEGILASSRNSHTEAVHRDNLVLHAAI